MEGSGKVNEGIRRRRKLKKGRGRWKEILKDLRESLKNRDSPCQEFSEKLFP